MAERTLTLRYRRGDGETSEYVLRSWREEGHYIIGFEMLKGVPRTFRKDRVVEYVGGCDRLLERPHAPMPTLPRGPRELVPQILFTGFPSVQRSALEAKAVGAGLQVVKTVTVGLMYLCGGPNAGPSKLQAARLKQTFILSEPQFHALLSTGELPDEESVDVMAY